MNKEWIRFTNCSARSSKKFLAVGFTGFILFVSTPWSYAEDAPLEVTTIVTQGGDDISYAIPLTVPVVYDGTTYQNVYATTNSVVTFGNPDGTYWTYPSTPSISIESRDWWALPSYNPEMHFIISTSAGGFQVDGAYLPYGTMQGQITNIVITGQIQTDGTVAYTYSVNGPLYGGERTGARLTDGTIVTLEEAGVVQVEEPVVLEPEPVPPTSEIVPEEPTPPTPVDPQPVVNPGTDHTPVSNETTTPPVESVVEPTPEEQPVDIPVVEIPQENIPETIPTETQPVEQVTEEALEPPVVEDTSVTLDNGVVLTQTQVAAVKLLSNPAELITAIFTNPMEALSALNQVGADMSPETREQSEKVVVAAVIVGNIATNAAGIAAYRRKP